MIVTAAATIRSVGLRGRSFRLCRGSQFQATAVYTRHDTSGPIVTAGGLVFIAATNFDRKFRAFDKANGKLLWETTLPFAGNATPATYQIGGRQYVVIYATGGYAREPSTGGVYVAFALPQK